MEKKMLKVYVPLVIAIVFCFSLTIPSGASAKAAKVLTFSSYLPITHEASKALDTAAKEIAAKSNGKISLKIFPASQLYNIMQTFDAVSEGAVDMGFNGLFGENRKNPVLGATGLPYVFPSFDATMKSCRGGLDDFMDKEANKLGVKVVAVAFTDYAQWFTVKKPFLKPEDFKGAQLRTFPGYVIDAAKTLGAAPVKLPTSEIYTSLQRGIVDGHIGTVESAIRGKFYEVEKYAVIGPFSIAPIHVIANLKAWNGLTKSEQRLITKTFEDMADKLVAIFKEKTLVSGPAELKKNGVTVHIQTPAEIAAFKKALQPVYDKYLKDAGPMGKKALELTR